MSPTDKWGGASKVSTFRYDAYKRIVDSADPHKFARIIDAFHAAVALGVRLNAMAVYDDQERREELVNVYSIDPDGVLWTIVSALHPDASGAERFNKLMSYADFGIRRLDEEFKVFRNLQVAIDSILAQR